MCLIVGFMFVIVSSYTVKDASNFMWKHIAIVDLLTPYIDVMQ